MVQLGIDFDPTPYQPAALCYYYHTQDLKVQSSVCAQVNTMKGKKVFSSTSHRYTPRPLHLPGNMRLPYIPSHQDTLNLGSWAERREEMADKLVDEAERYIPGLRQHTVTRLILTPEDYRKRTHQKHHSFGGVPPVMGNKPPAYKTPIAGLWFIGAQSESAGGVLNVMVGAQKVAKRILNGE